MRIHKVLKNTLIVFAVSYGCLQLGYTLFDISTRHVDRAANPDLGAKQKLSRNPVFLVSYADGHEVYFQNQHALAQSAINRGIDFILNYRRSHIDADFYQKHQAILDEKGGAGYWLWKPYLILTTMLAAPEGSVIVYADAGAIFTDSLSPILKHLETHDAIFYRFSTKTNEILKATMDLQVAEELGVTYHPDYETKTHLWAGFMIFRNCNATREFVENWLKLCTNPNFLKGYGKGRHFHDQSLMNAAYLKSSANFVALPEDDFGRMLKWQHRSPAEASYSLMPYQQPSMSYYEHKAWRFPLLKWLRYVLFRGWSSQE